MEKIICVVGPTGLWKNRPVHPPGRGAWRRGSLLPTPCRSIRGWTLAPPKSPRRRCRASSTMGWTSSSRRRTTPSPALSRKRNQSCRISCGAGEYAILTGGTGLYIDSLVAGRTFAPYPATGKRQELEALAARKGIGAVIALLEQFDPDSARRLHPSDESASSAPRRSIWRQARPSRPTMPAPGRCPPGMKRSGWGLDFESRQDLDARIDQRAAQMMAQGLLDEVRRLLAQGISPRATAMQAIGYKECLATLDGAMTEAEALAQICQASRRYAKLAADLVPAQSRRPLDPADRRAGRGKNFFPGSTNCFRFRQALAVKIWVITQRNEVNPYDNSDGNVSGPILT